jgi:MtrB/PioB family decaheme-associated outer membrane protein
MPVKAMTAVVPLWWYEGFAEIGGRFDLNHPDRKDLGKFYEYRDLRPGVFGNFLFGAHRTQDPFDIEFWGKNVGWNDQAFGLDLAKPGQYYLTFGWDETPHVFWQNAKTLYNGVGTNNLTIPVFLTPPPATAGNNATILANSHTIDLKIRRDTASAAARWTPTDNWDVNLDYSHMHREGTMALGAVSFSGATATRSAFELPRPVDETTQNGNLKAEYAGSTPWGKPFNVALGGGISIYDNADPSLAFQNPWNPTDTATRPLNNLYSLAPSNKAQSVNVSGGIGLPLNSRYMGTFQYTNMQVDDANLPWTNNTAYGSTPAFLTPSRNASTTLFNNVLHTQITSDLKSTVRYRYYNYNTKDDSPAVVFGSIATPWCGNPDSKSSCNTDNEMRFPRDFTKQNGNAELAWQAVKWLTVGAGYDWERWERGIYRDAPVTNENTGKVFADAKWGWSTLRTSLQYGERRYNEYQTPPIAGGVTDAFRMRDLANRDRTKGQASWAIDVTKMVTITPNAGFLYDDYRTNFNFFNPTEAGMKKAHSWNAGADATFNMSRDVALFVSYNYEAGNRQIYTQGNPNGTISGGFVQDGDRLSIETADRIHTFMFGSKVTVIPEKLYVDANYTFTTSTSELALNCTPAGCQYSPLATFPDIHNIMNRVDVQAKYMLDDSFMKNAGFAGKAYVKARVLWERNTNDSWQSLQNQFGYLVNPANATTTYSIWMGTGNPNYDVVVGQLSFGVKW